jgi:hypothetical protein
MAVWRPPERIKHLPSDAPWFTRAQVGESRLFSPIEVGSAKLRARIWVPAMVPWRASEELSIDLHVTPKDSGATSCTRAIGQRDLRVPWLTDQCNKFVSPSH